MIDTLRDQTLHCAACSQDFTWSVRDQEFWNQAGFLNRPTRCVPCRKNRREAHNLQAGIQLRCKECADPFTVGPDEQEWLRARGMNTPKRCRPCRRLRRSLQQEDWR
jgi:hypothetical protein